MNKHYGIFGVCIDTRQGKDALKNKKISFFADYLEEMKRDHPLASFYRVKQVYDNRTGNTIQCTLRCLREAEAYENSRSLSYRFKTKYFIHETDELGWLKLSKKETADAQALLEQRAAAKA